LTKIGVISVTLGNRKYGRPCPTLQRGFLNIVHPLINAYYQSMNIIDTKLSKLIFAEYNPRQLSKDQFQQIKDSITRFGIVDPIIVNSNKDRKNIIIGGHQRVKVALEMGIDTVPCHYIDLTRDRERELNVRLNKNTGEWDWSILAGAFDVDELIEWGFDEGELNFPDPTPAEGLTDEDAVPEVEYPITKLGDLWLLGEHRVLCGDATISTAVEKLMDGEKADMVFTDPPYGMAYQSNSWDSEAQNVKAKKTNDKISGDESTDTGIDAIRILPLFVGENVHIFIWCRWDSFDEFRSAVADFSSVKGNIVWDKGDSPGLGDVECSFGGNEQAVHSIIGRRKLKKRINSVWSANRPKGLSMLHPTQKPVEIILPALENCSSNGENILDLFLGSGSTLIACEKTGRKCYGMELDPHYCDVIVKRWEEYTGKKAEIA